MGETADEQSAQAASTPRGGRYVRLAEINVRHEFYTARGGMCTDLVIAPSPQTAARLAMFGFLTRRRADGLDLIWESDKLIAAGAMLSAVIHDYGEMPAMLRANLFASPLLFTVSLTNPEFANFTNMPTSLAIGEPPLLLSNNATKIPSPGATGLAADLVLDWDRVVERPPEPQPALTAYLNVVASEQIKEIEEIPGVVGDIAKKAIATFIAALKKANEPPVPRDLADAEWQLYSAKSTQFALLQVHFVPPPDAVTAGGTWNGFPVDGNIISDASHGPFTPCTYNLRFAARETTWRYLVAARHGMLDADLLEIVGAEDGSTGDFVKLPTPETLPNGKPAIAFDSKQPIALRQQPGKTWKLLGAPLKGRKAQTTLVPTLPIAGTGRIAPATGAPPGQPPPLARSDIYVFI